ncbi:BrnT family toxin [Salinarimonas chemoclinalis]|uniref:BrnT family toxin n=1 Tax=Salinarimonas chemoclinalis TaxID=3241599 RepID=UPI0035578AB7
MRIDYDPAKRLRTLAERGLDFDDALAVFSGRSLSFEDDRQDYGETRIVTIGFLGGRMMVVVWTPREDVRHVISMRKANGREQARYQERLGADRPTRDHGGGIRGDS